jgi:hypothetical protein
VPPLAVLQQLTTDEAHVSYIDVWVPGSLHQVIECRVIER